MHIVKIHQSNTHILPADWQWDSHEPRLNWDGHILQLIVGGKVEVHQEGGDAAFGGEGLLISSQPKKFRTRYHAVDNRRLELIWAHLTLTDESEHLLPKTCHMADPDFAVKLFRRGIDARRGGLEQPQESVSWLNAFLAEVFKNGTDVSGRHKSTSTRFHELAAEISRQPGGEWYFGLMAEEMGISYQTFASKFREATGCTPKMYLTQCRLEQARFLLVSSKRTVSEIAYSLGYCTPFAFTKIFTRHCGMSPKAYRTSNVNIRR